MKRRAKQLAVALLVLILIGAVARRFVGREPVFQGRKVTEWIKAYRPFPQRVAGTWFGGYDYSTAETSYFWVSITNQGSAVELQGWMLRDGTISLGTNRASAKPILRARIRPLPEIYERLGQRAMLDHLPEYEFLRDPTYLSLWQMGPVATPYLVMALERKSQWLDRLHLAAWQKCPAALRTNLLAAPFPSDQLRRNASAMLGQIGDAALPALPALTVALKDSDPAVRRNAARALKELRARTPAAIAGLIRALGDADKAVCEHAVEALGVIGPEARPAVSNLEKMLHIPGTNWDSEILIALDHLRPNATGLGPVIDELRRTKITDFDLLKLIKERKLRGPIAMLALGQMMTNSAAGSIGQLVVRYVEELGPEGAPLVPEVMLMLCDTNVISRHFAVRALGAIGPAASPAVPMLESLMPAARKPTAAAISNAIQQIRSPHQQ